MNTVRINTKPIGIFYLFILLAFPILSYADTDAPPISFSEIFKTSTTIQEDRTLDGNVKLESGTLNLNGQRLIINGDLIVSGGILYINGGKLTVNGSLTTSNKAKLQMTNTDDSVVITGNLTMGGSASIIGTSSSGGDVKTRYLSAGVITLAGNFKQLGKATGVGGGYGSSYHNYPNNRYSFWADDTHKIILNGDKKQTVSFDDAASKFSTLELKNTSLEGVEFSTSFRFDSLTQNNSKITLKAPLVSVAALSSNITLSGDTTVSNNLDLKGNELLVVNGNLIINKGTLNINGGKLTVNGSLTTSNTAKLQMTNTEDRVVIAGDLTIGGSASIIGTSSSGGDVKTRYLSAGVITLAGNFKQLGKATGVGGGYGSSYHNYPNNRYSFWADKTHKIILNGDKKQTVSFDDVASKLSTLELKNTSKEGVEFSTSFRFDSWTQNSSKITLKAPLVSTSALSSDITISGNVILSNSLDLNGHKLTINGNFILDSNVLTRIGMLSLNKGTLVVNGNLTTSNRAKLQMINAEDRLIITGNLTIGGSASIVGTSSSGGDVKTRYLSAGVITLAGNFKQLGKATGVGGGYGSSYHNYPNNRYSFWADEAHKIILNGDKKQTVSFDDVASKFSTLELKNTSLEGVELLTSFRFDSLIQNNSKITLKAPLVSTSVLSSDITISGDVTLSNSLDLNGHKLTINGNFILDSNVLTRIGMLSLNKGTLTVRGNLTTSNRAKIQMINTEDSVVITGNLTMGGSSSIVGTSSSGGDVKTRYLSAGVITLAGNFKQLGKAAGVGGGYGSSYHNYPNNRFSFWADKTHKIILNGDKKQTVSFDDAASKFSTLELKNTSQEGVELLTSFRFDSLTQNNSKITLKAPLVSAAALSSNITLSGDTTISNNLDLKGNELLVVNGNLIINKGTLNINGGKLTVNGSLTTSNTAKLQMTNTEDRVVIAGDLTIGGSASIIGTSSSGGDVKTRYLSAGIITLAGNFKQLGKATGVGGGYGSSYHNYPNNRYSFWADKTHKIILNGDKKQTVSFDDVASKLSTLELKNTSKEGVEFSTSFRFDSWTQNSSKIILKAPLVSTSVLSSDITISGNVTLSNSLDLNGHKLTINGNFILDSNVLTRIGMLSLNKGTLAVNGNLTTSNRAKLQMINAEDRLIITGNLTMGGSASIVGTSSSGGDVKTRYLSAGVITLAGNFKQLGKATGVGGGYGSSYHNYPNNRYSYWADEAHRLILNGKDKQTISFESASSRFNILEITNTSSEGVVFDTKAVVSTLFDHHRNAFVLADDSESNFVDYDKDGMKDHLDPYPTDPDNNVSDRDGDGVEDDNDAFPDDHNESVDTDNDGTGNNADTDDDDDGLPDTWEITNTLDPLDPSDATNDDDDDGASNLEEFTAGTDPKDASSKPLAISANAGADKTLVINSSIKISGSGVGTNNSQITGFEWKEGTTVLASTSVFTYTPTTDGVHTLTLLVTDASGATASDNVLISVSDPNSVDLQEGLVGHYEFEGNVNDSSNNGYHGIEHGGLTYVDGVIQKSIKFTNYMDLVELPKEILNGSTASTTSIWIRSETVDTGVGILTSSGQTIANEYLLFIGDDNGKGVVNFILHNDDYIGQREINDKRYHLVSIVRTPTHIKYYIDGVLDSAFEKSVDQLTIDSSVWLGNDLDCLDGCWDATQQFKGELDELRIYNRALNEAEIQALYKQGETNTLSEFDGQWEGNGEQTNGSKWSIAINIDSSTKLHTISYPSLNCGGDLTLVSATNTRVEFNENITFGNCVDNGKTVLVKSNDNKADFLWYFENGIQDASGIVERDVSDEISNITGEWEGTYFCAQGETGLTLTVRSTTGNELEADFSFYPTELNPSVKSGRYIMSGNYTNTGALYLGATAWIDDSSGYAMVDLDGVFDESYTTYIGTVDHPANNSTCSSFSLKKVETIPKKLIKGVVSNDDGVAVQNINVKFEYLVDGEEQSVTAITDDEGKYEIEVNKSYFDEASEVTYLIYAYKGGYHPETQTLQIGVSDSYSVDFVINSIQANEVVLEIEPQVHHLGDDSFSGSVNSQFQKKTEGTSFSKNFEITSVQYTDYEKATLTFEAKGIQDFDNKLAINNTSYILPSSPSDGSYKTYTIELDKSVYQSAGNNLIITSGFASDYDDFEFANIVITFTGTSVEADDDKDGYPNDQDAFPDDPNEWLDTDSDGTGNNADTDDDGDKIPDTWELQYGFDPLDPADALADGDNDGASNYDEFLGGTNPTDGSSNPNAQIVEIQQSVTKAPLGKAFTLSAYYNNTSSDQTLTGIGVRIHFDSTKLNWNDLDNALEQGLVARDETPIADLEDLDNIPATDFYVSVAWTSFSGEWPNQSMPLKLYDALFSFKEDANLKVGDTTTLGFSASATANGYVFIGTPYTVVIAPAFTFDIDGDGAVQPLTDGLLLLRYQFGFRGDPMISNAVSSTATRTSADAIGAFLEQGSAFLDIDGDGESKPLTDGLLLLRYLFGFRGDTLINNAVGAEATRASAADIEAYISEHQ